MCLEELPISLVIFEVFPCLLVLSREDGTLVHLLDGCCDECVFVDVDAPPSQTLLDLFQLHDAGCKVLALIPFEVDLVRILALSVVVNLTFARR